MSKVVQIDRGDGCNLYLKKYRDRYGHDATLIIKEVDVDTRLGNLMQGIEFEKDECGLLSRVEEQSLGSKIGLGDGDKITAFKPTTGLHKNDYMEKLRDADQFEAFLDEYKGQVIKIRIIIKTDNVGNYMPDDKKNKKQKDTLPDDF